MHLSSMESIHQTYIGRLIISIDNSIETMLELKQTFGLNFYGIIIVLKEFN